MMTRRRPRSRRDAAQEKEAADKATTKAGDCESGNKDQVEQLEDKLEKFCVYFSKKVRIHISGYAELFSDL